MTSYQQMSTLLLGPHVAAATDRDEALAILTDAFEEDAAVREFFPEIEAHRRLFPSFATLFAGPSFELGGADQTVDGLGAALWLPPGVEADPEQLMAFLEEVLPRERKGALLAGMEAQGALHPHEPHWYLPFIGVRREAQRLGIGGSLLAHGLDRADFERMPVYLEATSRMSVPFYERFGFEVIGAVESPDYPEIFAMWRPAQR